MLVTVICTDKPGALALRTATRDSHVAYLKSTDVVQAGPFLDSDGKMCGSLVIIDVADMAAANDWAANDPYALAGLFETVRLEHWNRVIG